MAKKKGKKADPEKKALLQAKKEAKADKAALKRLQKDSRSGSDGAGESADSEEHDVFEALLQQYRTNDHKSIQSAQLESLDGFPLPRANSTLTLYEDTKKKNADLYLFGGEYYDGIETVVLDHLLVYNVAKNEWKRIYTPVYPPPRCAHSCVYYNHALYVFGGESNVADQYMHHKDCWKFDIKKQQWEEIKSPKAVGTHPTGRSGHTAIVWKHYMIVFGGFFEAMKDTPRWFNDVFVMDLQTHQWLDIPHSKLSSRPEPRSACNACVVGDDLVIHGGFSKLSKGNSLSRSSPTITTHAHNSDQTITSETKVHSDAWLLHLKPLLSDKPPTWERLTSSVQRGALNAAKSPNGRAGTTSVAFKNRLLSFGGVHDSENFHHKVNSIFYADLFAFDVERRKWFPIQVKELPAGAKGKRRRRKTADAPEAKIDETAENQESEDDSDDEEGDLILEDEEEKNEGDIKSGKNPGWDLEKLRSNMFAFVDGKGNLVFEKTHDSDNEDENSENKGNEEMKDEEKDGEDNDGEEAKPPTRSKPKDERDSGEIVPSSSVMVLNPETNKPEAVVRDQPLPRINSELVVTGNVLYVYGGLLEVGDREVTLDDLWSLDLRKQDKWNCIWKGTMHKQVWRGAIHDDDDSYYSSTNDRGGGEDDDDDEEEDEEEDEEKDEEEKDEAKEETKEESKKKEKSKRSEIREQMNEVVRMNDMQDESRTPNPGENLADFYARTSDLWNRLAAEQSKGSSKEMKREGFNLAKQRFEKLIPAMERLKELDIQYKKATAEKKERK